MNVFISTRNAAASPVDFANAILSPTASENGLYTLRTLPHIDFEQFLGLDYGEQCQRLFNMLDLGISDEILQKALQSYQSFDTPANPAPLHRLDRAFFLELYHGPTRAFKDMALCPFGEIFSTFARKNNQQYLILTATSGDTGPATLRSFANKPNIKVVCLYPKGGTSQVQALQMMTASAKNLKVFGIEGNFDDAQSLLKALLVDKDFNNTLESKGYALSAANSVNFGRIAFQIVYYIWGYCTLVQQKHIVWGEEVYAVVPSGNFGNALGAFFAKLMGLPLKKIIVASNQNNILTEFIQTGVYDITTKTLAKTLAPAMDILKSSNVERVLFALFGDKRTKELLYRLDVSGRYVLDSNELMCLQDYFGAWWGDDIQTKQYIKAAYDKGYIIDPHTALAYGAYLQCCQSSTALICSTAEWSKFAPSVVNAIFGKICDDFEAIEIMLANGASIGKHIQELSYQPILHNQVFAPSALPEVIAQWL